MTLSPFLPKLLAKRFAKPKSPQKINQQMKLRQVLPMLTKNQQAVPRFQGDDSPPGFRIQWRM